MKRPICFAILLAMASSSALAEWAVVGTNDISSLYADPATMRKAGNVVTMWYLIDYKESQSYRDGKTYLSTKTQAEHDCKKVEWRQLSYAWHAGNMGAGKVVTDGSELSDPAAKWHAVPSSSGSELLWKFACEMGPSVLDFSKKR